MTKIISDSGDKVLIESRPWGLGLFLIAVILGAVYTAFTGWESGNWVVIACSAALGGGAWWWFKRDMRLTRLTLNPDGTANLSIRGPHGTDRRSFGQGTLRAAVNTHRSSDGETHRLMLLIDGPGGQVERLPFTYTYSSLGNPDVVVKRIMDWRTATA